MKTIARGQISITSIDAAYNVSLSSYEEVIKGDVQYIKQDSVVTDNVTVTTGGKKVLVTSCAISTHVQAFKGEQELIYSNSPQLGSYSVALVAVGCTANICGGVVRVTNILKPDNAYVNIAVNCEGNAVYHKKFRVTTVKDGTAATGYSLMSDVAQVSRNSIGNFEPGQFAVKLYSTKGDATPIPHRAYIATYGVNGNTQTLINAEQATTLNDTIAVKVSANYNTYCIKAYLSPIFTFFTDALATTSITVVEQGQNPAQGSMPRNRGQYDPLAVYVYDRYYQDNVFIINSAGVSFVYQVAVFGTQLQGVNPLDSAQWTQGNKQIFTAIETAIIDGGDIGGFLFKDRVMQSRDRTDGAPNTTINGRTGEIATRKLTAIGGKIGALDIDKDGLMVGGGNFNNINSYFTGATLKLREDFLGIMGGSSYSNKKALFFAGVMDGNVDIPDKTCSLYVSDAYNEIVVGGRTATAILQNRSHNSGSVALQTRGGISFNLNNEVGTRQNFWVEGGDIIFNTNSDHAQIFIKGLRDYPNSNPPGAANFKMVVVDINSGLLAWRSI